MSIKLQGLQGLQGLQKAKEGNKAKSLLSLKPKLSIPVSKKVEEATEKPQQDDYMDYLLQSNGIEVPENNLTDKKEDDKKEDKKDKKGKKSKKGGDKEPPIQYNGPRTVIVYNQELFIEEDPTVTLEDIRQRLVKEYGFSEFKDKSKCQIHFDAKTGEVFPILELKKKG